LVSEQELSDPGCNTATFRKQLATLRRIVQPLSWGSSNARDPWKR